MNETTKTKRTWGDLEWSILRGEGIDIGCGPDPVLPCVVRFDLEHGDANEINRYVRRQFDFVFSSHCLEHMRDPRAAVSEWWQLVRPGGHLLFIVPDEDLYEQGMFPSRFNPDHKATFTISKSRSWSPVSINVLDLARSLPGGELVSLVLQDHSYDRRLLRHGPPPSAGRLTRLLLRCYRSFRRVTGRTIERFEALARHYAVHDQTQNSDTLAQIQCIVRKTP